MNKSITFKELDELTKSFSNFLIYELNLKKGDRIAIQSPNVLQYPVALFHLFLEQHKLFPSPYLLDQYLI